MILPVALFSACFLISASQGSEKTFHPPEDDVEAETGNVATTPLPNINIKTTSLKTDTINFPDPCPRNEKENKDILREIQLPGSDSFKAACVSYTVFGSGWLFVYKKRFNSQKFNRTYEDHERGFGEVGTEWNNEFFIGLNRLHYLTSGKPHEVLLVANASVKRCGNFVVGDQSEGYKVKSIGNCNERHLWTSPKQGSKFSTFDQDEDGVPDRNLAKEEGFGWWFDPGMSLEENYINMYIRRTD